MEALSPLIVIGCDQIGQGNCIYKQSRCDETISTSLTPPQNHLISQFPKHISNDLSCSPIACKPP
jgi:hypothetical protein